MRKIKFFSIRSFLESKYYLIFGFIFSWVLITISGIQGVQMQDKFDTRLTLDSQLAFFLALGFFTASLIFFAFYYFALFIFVHTKRINFNIIKKSFWLITIVVFLTIIINIIVLLILKEVISIKGFLISDLSIEDRRNTAFWAFIIFFPLVVISAFVGISVSTKMFLQWQNELKSKFQRTKKHLE